MTVYACDRCGKKDVAEHQTVSRKTGMRYCRDWASCDRRYAQQQAEKEYRR